MGINQSICTSFKVELLRGIHDFTTDVFKLALYGPAASLSALTTTYTSTGEIAAVGAYTAGGVTLTPTLPSADGTTALLSFANLSIAADLTAHGALIYNSSKANRAVLTLDFGGARSSISGAFPIVFPTANAQSAIIRIG